MKAKILGLLAVGLLAGPMAAQAVSYVGVYRVTDGALWPTNPPVYSALEAAELVFGPAAPGAHYEISIAGIDPLSITNTGWYAIIGVGPGAFAESYSLDSGPTPGYDGGGWSPGDDVSAYVNDPFFNDDQGYNYVFLVPHRVPEPASLALLGLGLAGLGLSRRRKA